MGILIDSGTGPTSPAGIGVTGAQGPAGVTGPGTVSATVPPEAGTPTAQKKPIAIPPNFEKFPAELKLLPNWLLWRYLPPKSSGAKWRKVPFQRNGKPASTTDRSSWSRFEECCATYAQGAFDGVGFVFDGEIGADGLCYCGVDFDACVHHGTKVDSLALRRINRLNTYTELSVSGTGFHCIVRAEPLDRIVKFDGVEVYTKRDSLRSRAPPLERLKLPPPRFARLLMKYGPSKLQLNGSNNWADPVLKAYQVLNSNPIRMKSSLRFFPSATLGRA